MSVVIEQQAPHLSVEDLESILSSDVLNHHEKMYVINRIVGEYAAYNVIDHLDRVYRHDAAVASGQPAQMWREIDRETQDRYQEMVSVLRDTNLRGADFSENVEWNWLTLHAINSFRETARATDDSIVQALGVPVQRTVTNERTWQQYRDVVKLEGSLRSVGGSITTQGLDDLVIKDSRRIISKYTEEVHESTPYLNEYADGACLAETTQVYARLRELGQEIDPRYDPSREAYRAAHASVLNRDVRPDKYEVIDALVNGEFEDLMERTVMPDDEFDDLLNDAVEVYMRDHESEEDVMSHTTTMMDTAQRQLHRPVVWRDADLRHRLEQQQELRNEEVAATTPTGEIKAVETDAAGLPNLDQADDPNNPQSVEDAELDRRYHAAQEELHSIDRHASLDLDDGSRINEMIDSRIAEEANERKLREEEETQMQNAKIAELAEAMTKVETEQDSPSY